jgi:hypothetical protein
MLVLDAPGLEGYLIPQNSEEAGQRASCDPRAEAQQ